MKISRRAIVGVLIGMVLSGCGPQHIFSPQVLEGVDQNFDFTAWRMVPNAKAGKKVQLGGRILQAPQRDGLVTMVLTQLPIVEHPAYGPTDTERGRGEFLVYFNGKVPMNHLQPGNRVIVIGTTQHAAVVAIEDSQRSLPALTAECLHIWNTGGKEIADFPNFGAGYQPLEEETYCAASR
jgi:starvation-inducible outer membrane lipoprotein